MVTNPRYSVKQAPMRSIPVTTTLALLLAACRAHPGQSSDASVDAIEPIDGSPDAAVDAQACTVIAMSTDPCLGVAPACSSGCADGDRDGLNDAWEVAGGVDLDGDGVVDTCHDLLLPGADRNVPDVFVMYDWMDYAAPGNGCTVDTDCTKLGAAHAGETCTGPQVHASEPHSCGYACTVDADCRTRPPAGAVASRATDRCLANVCSHTHDPEVTTPGALAEVTRAFADHGIQLHVVRGQAQPHSLVASFRPNATMTAGCEGASNADVGPAKYADSIYDLKSESHVDPKHIAYHYALFAHYSSCDTFADCFNCPTSLNPDGSPKNAPLPGESGIAEISGNDFIISLGNPTQDIAIAPQLFRVAGTFMHELGHNLGLHHGGGIDVPCTIDADCAPAACTQTTVGKFCLFADDTNWKPNYLSIMNYRYQFTGIVAASGPGSTTSIACTVDADCPTHDYCHASVCSRLDFSNETLPTGGNTPGRLDQINAQSMPIVGDPALGLNEPAGLGASRPDLFTYTDSQCDVPPLVASSQGPVDWDGDGDPSATSASADLTSGVDHACQLAPVNQLPELGGATDWPGAQDFTYNFQCTPFGGPNGDGAVMLVNEMSVAQASDAHVLLPPRSAAMFVVASGGSSITIALRGTRDFRADDVVASSLRLGRALPRTITIRDADGDGQPDLVAVFGKPGRRGLHVRGFLRSTQIFSAELVSP
jgi:hypothetical protein